MHEIKKFGCELFAALSCCVMRGGAQFRGSSHDQDYKYADKQKKLKNSLSFPEKFNKKIAKSSVKLECLQPWMKKRVTELLGMEQDDIADYAYFSLEHMEDVLDAKDLQIALQGFLLSNASVFVSELWDLLLDASTRPDGVPMAIRIEQEMQKEAVPVKQERVIEMRESGSSSRRDRERRDRDRRSRSRSRSRGRSRRSRSRSRSRERDRRRNKRSRSR